MAKYTACRQLNSDPSFARRLGQSVWQARARLLWQTTAQSRQVRTLEQSDQGTSSPDRRTLAQRQRCEREALDQITKLNLKRTREEEDTGSETPVRKTPLTSAKRSQCHRERKKRMSKLPMLLLRLLV
jgi:hypothetical protein